MNADALLGALETATVHRQRLLAAIAHIGPRLPQTAEAMAEMPYEDIASVELLLSRFGKLQDLLGAKVFRLVAELTDEPLPTTATFIDLLHQLERIGALPSAAGWRQLRQIRNDLAHDYPDDPGTAVVQFAEVVAAVPQLVAVDAAIRAHVGRVLGQT